MLPLLLAACAAGPADVFARGNLVAWCVVPFDGKKRGPDDRVAMLARLGFTKYAYDWRAEHLPTFDRECELLRKANIEPTAVWFPAAVNDDAKQLLAVIEKHKLTPQLWVMLPQPKATGQADKVAEAAAGLKPVAEAADRLGCKVAIYNHGGWSGEPENQLAVIATLGRRNVGIVYNLHHGHDHLGRFPELLAKVKPHLLCLNLNGMSPGADKAGRKILLLGHGERDLDLLRTIAASGYAGPVGVIGHTTDDAEERLADNLAGLDWLRARVEGKDPGPRPTPKTQPGR